jgi:hypothetical protein
MNGVEGFEGNDTLHSLYVGSARRENVFVPAEELGSVGPRTARYITGYLLGFPATLFLSTVQRALRELITRTRPTCYVSKHTVVYDEGE